MTLINNNDGDVETNFSLFRVELNRSSTYSSYNFNNVIFVRGKKEGTVLKIESVRSGSDKSEYNLSYQIYKSTPVSTDALFIDINATYECPQMY